MDNLALGKLKQFNAPMIGYKPLATQQQVHDSTAQIIIVSGGERSGKSVVTAAELALRYPTWDSVLLVVYKTKSAKNEAGYLHDFLKRIGKVKEYHAPDEGNISLVTTDGKTVESVSTYAEGGRAVSGTGRSYSIIAMLEAGKQRYEVFESCLIRASATNALFILSGTIEKSEPWFADLITRMQGDNEIGAQVVIMPTWENRYYYPGGRDDPKIKTLEATLTQDMFNERLAAIPAPLDSLVFKEFSFPSHVFDWVQYDPGQTVECWVDYGYSGSHYSIAFVQFHPRAYTRQFHPDLPDASLTDVWVIGDLYLDHTTHEEAIDIAKQLSFWSNVVGGVGDVVGKTHPQAGQSPFEVWFQKARIALRGEYILVQDNIDRHKTFLKESATGKPRIFFNPGCKGLMEYARWKRREVGEHLYGEAEKGNCDFLKAIGYGLIDHFGRVESLYRPQAVAFGEPVVNLENARQQLPEAFPGVTVPQKPQPAKPNQQYVFIPRVTRKIG